MRRRRGARRRELGKADRTRRHALPEPARVSVYALHERHLLRRAATRGRSLPLPNGLRPDVSFTDNIAELPDGRILFGAYEGQGERIAFDGPSLPTFDPRSGRFDSRPPSRGASPAAGGGRDAGPHLGDHRQRRRDAARDVRWPGVHARCSPPAGDGCRARDRSSRARNGEIVIVADGTGIGRWRQGKLRGARPRRRLSRAAGRSACSTSATAATGSAIATASSSWRPTGSGRCAPASRACGR